MKNNTFKSATFHIHTRWPSLKLNIQMIPIFRKIRKKMLDDNRPLKYIRYAIGEIILVVIGILIALQINNWNEQRKDHIKLRSNLIEIKASLENDLKLLNASGVTLDSYEGSGIYLLNFLSDKLEVVDSTQLKSSFLFTGFYIDFSLNSVPYEKLAKENNLELIMNDSIVTVLSNFYKKYDSEKLDIDGERQNLKNYRDYTTNFADSFTIRDAFLFLLKEYYGVSFEAYKLNNFNYDSMVLNWNKMKLDKKFHIILDKVLIGRMAERLKFYQMKADISNLLKMLDMELEKSR